MENCPYCNKGIEIDHDGGYEEGVLYEQECPECGKIFVYSVNVCIYYDTSKADCLNDEAEHDYKPTTTVPIEYTKMRCTMCDKERQPTAEEWESIYANKKKS